MIVCRPCLGREEVDVLGRNWPLGARFGPRRLRILFKHRRRMNGNISDHPLTPDPPSRQLSLSEAATGPSPEGSERDWGGQRSHRADYRKVVLGTQRLVPQSHLRPAPEVPQSRLPQSGPRFIPTATYAQRLRSHRADYRKVVLGTQRLVRILFKHVLFYILRDAVACAQAQGTRTAAALVSKLQAAVAALLWPALPSPAQGT